MEVHQHAIPHLLSRHDGVHHASLVWLVCRQRRRPGARRRHYLRGRLQQRDAHVCQTGCRERLAGTGDGEVRVEREDEGGGGGAGGGGGGIGQAAG